VNGQWLIESRNHVHPSGQFVYIGNRAAPAGGRNEIAVFRIKETTGEPSLVDSTKLLPADLGCSALGLMEH
jgi:6-phosphogluconolactonase (cycloisomerase 2 family)